VASSSEVKRHQDEITRLREQSAKESTKIGAARVKAGKARAAAGKSQNASTVRSKSAGAVREEKKATDAETARGGLDKKIAAAEAKLFAAQRRYTMAVEREQSQAVSRLTSVVDRRQSQFTPAPQSSVASSPAPGGVEADTSRHVFISHASEDKEDFVRPLQALLTERGVTTWLDELDIGWGKSIRQSIDAGIAGAQFGLVVISPHFIEKKWTKAELDALYGRQLGETEAGGFILPVWHKVTRDDVQENLPTVAGLKALSTAVFTVAEIADQIAKLVHPAPLPPSDLDEE
jgi:hypothetical protein